MMIIDTKSPDQSVAHEHELFMNLIVPSLVPIVKSLICTISHSRYETLMR